MKHIKTQHNRFGLPAAGGRFGNWFEKTGVAYIMLLPVIVLFSMFFIYPVLWTFRYMFFEYDGISRPAFIGFGNFIKAFTNDPYWWSSVLTTLKFAAAKLVIEMPLAIVLAACLNQKIPGKGFFRGVYFLPTVTSIAVMSLVFTFMFSPYNGMVNLILKSMGLIKSNIAFLDEPGSAFMVCVLLSVWHVFGQNVLLVLSGLLNIPAELYESASLDGASKLKSFFHITLPMVAPMLRIIFMFAIIGSLQSTETILVLTGGGPNRATEVMGINIYNHFFVSNTVPAYGYGSVLGFLSSIVVGGMTLVYMYFSRKTDSLTG